MEKEWQILLENVRVARLTIRYLTNPFLPMHATVACAKDIQHQRS